MLTPEFLYVMFILSLLDDAIAVTTSRNLCYAYYQHGAGVVQSV